ncbi:MAG: glutamate--tRNA ligase [Flexibacteraceae bacterium]
MEREVRVRFAPSPTGALHIGGLRTALFNYLLAKQKGGKFILRIEDTDQTRFVGFAEEYIKESLAWLGISPDEGVFEGGPHAPYRQSERKAMYMQYAMQLVESGHAYYAFDTSEELEEMRARLTAARVVSPQYNSISRMQMKNSLTLPEDEVKAKLAAGEPYVIRLKVPRKEEVRLNDIIRGWVMVHTATLDDKVLMKSDGMPTYHLANVVDDHLMEITHVIRGEEWLPSAPTHVLLYRYLGWEETMPRFAHLPLLLKPDGNGKLSKRDGENGGYPVFPLEWKEQEEGRTIMGFREEGYLPEALMNFLVLLGWSPGDNRELFTKEELIQQFSLERIGQAGTKFDIAKAKWFNRHYLLQKSEAEQAVFLQADLDKHGITASAEMVQQVCALVKDRVNFPSDFWAESHFIFQTPTEYNKELIGNKWTEEAVQVLTAIATKWETTDALTVEDAKHQAHEVAEGLGIKPGKVMGALRFAVTAAMQGPDLMGMIAILGGKAASARIKTALSQLA